MSTVLANTSLYLLDWWTLPKPSPAGFIIVDTEVLLDTLELYIEYILLFIHSIIYSLLHLFIHSFIYSYIN